jgi:hypothetical protein
MFSPLRLAACAAMTGILWIVQLLVYPGFAEIPAQSWLSYHQRHCSRITWIVAPLMVAELGLAAEWVWRGSGWAPIANLAGVLAGWLLTFFLSVPLHDRLGSGLNEPALTEGLVKTNWPRTILWSARLGLLLAVF